MIREKARTVWFEVIEDGQLLRIVLDAGKGNVLDSATIGALRAGLVEHADAPRLRAWILDHAGPHFSFGASVEEHAPGKVAEMLPRFHGLIRDIVHLDLPYLACVRGMCLGGGLELVLPADRVFASKTLRLGQPEIKLGVFAPFGSVMLPRLIGPHRAADLLLSGRTIGAEEAGALGLVSEIAEEPLAAAIAWAREHLFPKSVTAIRHQTRLLRRDLRQHALLDLEEAERAYLGPLMATHDAREGIAAFLEKRDPVWEIRG